MLTFIFVVKDWIIAISGKKGYRLFSYVCPQRKYYTPYGKMFFQILWGINVKATHNCSGPFKKQKKRKENIMGLWEDKNP